MINAEEIRNQLASYVLHELSLDEFEDWFVEHSWNAHQNPDRDTQALVFEVESRLSELSGGYVDDSIFQKRVSELLRGYSANVSSAGSIPMAHISTASSPDVIRPDVLRAVVHAQHAGVSG